MNLKDKKTQKKLNVIILMAGQGKRMGNLTDDRPKALLRTKNGQSIFSHIIQSFRLFFLDPTIIPVIGHGVAKVEQEIKDFDGAIQIHKVFNPFYKTTGPLISLWLGLLSSKDENIAVINGDTIISKNLTKEIQTWFIEEKNHSSTVGLCVSKTDRFSKDDMKVALDINGSFMEVGKHLIPDEKTLKSAGVFMVKGERTKKALGKKIDGILKTDNAFKTSYHWHNLVNELSKEYPIDLIQVKAKSWCEMDTIEEFEGMEID